MTQREVYGSQQMLHSLAWEQQHEEQWLPVTYASRELTLAESRYTQIDKAYAR